MRWVLYALALLFFLVFWMVYTPVYTLAHFLDWVDQRLNRYLESGWRGDREG